MERHFSNRGERLAEVTAARTLGGRKPSAKSAIRRDGRQATIEQWFSHPVEAVPRLKTKTPKPKVEDTAFL